MIADYSKDEGVSAAIAMTFDGKNPCDMCKGISKSKSEEKKNETVKSEKKVETPIFPSQAALVYRMPASSWTISEICFLPAPHGGPPSPPPRALLA
jgi:hypothetical protein